MTVLELMHTESLGGSSPPRRGPPPGTLPASARSSSGRGSGAVALLFLAEPVEPAAPVPSRAGGVRSRGWVPGGRGTAAAPAASRRWRLSGVTVWGRRRRRGLEEVTTCDIALAGGRSARGESGSESRACLRPPSAERPGAFAPKYLERKKRKVLFLLFF